MFDSPYTPPIDLELFSAGSQAPLPRLRAKAVSMPEVSAEKGRWRLTGPSRYGGGGGGSWAETWDGGRGAGVKRGGKWASARESGGSGISGPVRTGRRLRLDLLCQRRPRRAGQGWVEAE